MSLYIDQPQWSGHGRHWAHLISDVSFTELHEFARTAGIPLRGFDYDHYDIPTERWDSVVALGVTPTTSREVVRLLHAAGLRRPKRRGTPPP